MVSFLISYVLSYGIGRGGTDSERSVTFLPAKVSVEILFHPIRRILLQISHNVRKTMHWTEAYQYVSMIIHATNNLSDAVHSSYHSAKIRM